MAHHLRAGFLAFAWLALAPFEPAQAQTAEPAFDCSGDLSPTEETICSTNLLAKADAQLAGLYRQAVAAATDAAGMKAAQRQFLKTRDACKTDADCILAAYQVRMAALATKATSAQAGPEGIGFQFDQPIDGYRVSGLWFPVVLPDDPAPMGPVLIRLTDAQTGQGVQISENAVALLDQAATDALTTSSGQIDFTRAKGVLHLSYGAADRASTGPCPESGDTCLFLGEIPVDLQDLDFDGKPDVVIAHKGMGQRGSTAYSVYAINEGEGVTLGADNLGQGIWGYPVFARIDSLTSFNLDQRVIEVENSGGACASSVESHPADAATPFALTLYQVDAIDANGDCVTQGYRVETRDDGVVTYRPVQN